MRLTGPGWIVSLACVALLAAPGSAEPARAQNEPGRGWIEGVIVTDKGAPATTHTFGTAATLTIRPKEGNGIRTENDPSKGGFYTFRNLRPGIYEVFVDATARRIRDEDIKYRPQHIFGLVVEPDKRTVLNIVVHEGEALEEVGKPDVVSEKAIILAEELARLRKEIEELKRAVEELKKK